MALKAFKCWNRNECNSFDGALLIYCSTSSQQANEKKFEVLKNYSHALNTDHKFDDQYLLLISQ